MYIHVCSVIFCGEVHTHVRSYACAYVCTAYIRMFITYNISTSYICASVRTYMWCQDLGPGTCFLHPLPPPYSPPLLPPPPFFIVPGTPEHGLCSSAVGSREGSYSETGGGVQGLTGDRGTTAPGGKDSTGCSKGVCSMHVLCAVSLYACSVRNRWKMSL